MSETKYCLCCGEEVEFNRIERNERIEFTCIYCGFPLSVDDKPLVKGTEVDVKKTVSPPKPVPSAKGKELRYILVADDSRYTRKIIMDILLEKKLADKVITFENGLELTSTYAKLLTTGENVDVIIIDINMPIMDGITAAKTIRSIESQNRVPSTPIAFFSSVKADENLRGEMEMLSPAHYVNKGADPNPDKLAERVEQLVSYFIQIKK